METQLDTRILTASDRCDCCAAAGKVVVAFSGGELIFCAHHARAHGPALLEQGIVLVDTDQTLQETRALA